MMTIWGLDFPFLSSQVCNKLSHYEPELTLSSRGPRQTTLSTIYSPLLTCSRRQHHAATPPIFTLHTFSLQSSHPLRNTSRAPNDASVRAHNRLTDMEHLKVAFSNTGGNALSYCVANSSDRASKRLYPSSFPQPKPPP
jgi:hypothetical protein